MKNIDWTNILYIILTGLNVIALVLNISMGSYVSAIFSFFAILALAVSWPVQYREKYYKEQIKKLNDKKDKNEFEN